MNATVNDAARVVEPVPPVGPEVFDDLLVIELGSRVGAGACGSLLAQLGATVVLIEPPERPDGVVEKRGKWNYRAQFASGKRSVRGSVLGEDQLISDLLQRADIVIVSSDVDPGIPDLSGRTGTHAVICDITAYGAAEGAAGARGDSDWQVQARAGLVATTGTKEGPPLCVPFPIVEMMTGTYAAAAILSAMRIVSRTHRGQYIDMALYDCAFVSLTSFLPRLLIGESTTIQRLGNRHAMIAPWNVYPAQDGWLLICAGSDAQWQRLCGLMKREDLITDPRTSRGAERIKNADFVDRAVSDWIRTQTVDRCVHALNDAQIACGAVTQIDGYPREDNLRYRGMVGKVADPLSGRDIHLPGSPLRMSQTPGRSPDRIPAPDDDRESASSWLPRRRPDRGSSGEQTGGQPLEGIRVVEIGHYTTIPLSARLLGSLGADVIKIEPPDGETTRGWVPTHEGQGYFFTLMNSDKRSLSLDLRKASDVAILRNLLQDADVLVENLKPGALARRGFSADMLAELNPRLIYCSVSGFGSDSLYAGRPAFDSVIQAMSGVMDVLRAGDVPLKTGISCADLMGGEVAVVALLAALEYRERTGHGQNIDLSMQDICAWLTQTVWGGDTTKIPTLPCSDGAILAELDPPQAEELGPIIAGFSRSEALEFLQRRDIRAAPVLSVAEAVVAPITKARKLWFAVEERGTAWPLLANPMRLEGSAVRVRKPIPSIGHDNREILAELARRTLDAQ